MLFSVPYEHDIETQLVSHMAHCLDCIDRSIELNMNPQQPCKMDILFHRWENRPRTRSLGDPSAGWSDWVAPCILL